MSLLNKLPSLRIGLLLALSALMLLPPAPASSLSNVGPDGPSFANLPYRNYHLSNSGVVPGVTQLTVPIYFLTSGNINDIPAGGVPITVSYIAGPGGSGITSGSAPVQFGASSTANNKVYTTGSTPGSFTIPRSAFTVDPENGRLTAFIHGRLIMPTTAFRSFRLTAPTAYWIGFSNDAGSVFAIGNRNRCETGSESACGDYYDYNLLFAPPCTAGTGLATIRLRDIDPAGALQINPQYNSVVTYVVTDMTTGATVSTSQNLNYSSGAMSYIYFSYIGTHKYRFTMNNVYVNNVIQANLPFDSIYYYDPCPKPTEWIIGGTSNVTPIGGYAQPGTALTYTHIVRNNGPETTDKPVTAQVQRSFDGGATISSSEPAVVIASGRPVGIMRTENNGYTPTSADVGRTICERVTFTPRAWNINTTNTSPWACVTIVASPRISIVGGDAVSGGNVDCSVGGGGFHAVGGNPGSFGEYGVLSTGDIVNFYSAGLTGSRVLSFANTAPVAGNFAPTRCLTDLVPKLTAGVTWTPGFVSGSALPAGGGNLQVGSATIGTSSMTAGNKWLIRGDTVTISGNLTYTGATFAGFSNVPSLVIIADRIIINSNVTQIDGLLIVDQNLTTCREAGDTHAIASSAASKPSMATGGACRANRLTINGAVIVGNQLVTARSIGGGSPAEPPAEIIRFRPEVFLTPYENGAAAGSLITDLETELPPRN